MKNQKSNIKNQKYKLKFKSFGVCGLVLIFALCTLILGLAPVNAQESRTITIVPPSISHTLNPGQAAEGRMKVVNDSTETLVFKVSTQDFVVTDAVGTPSLLPPDYLSKKFSAASWIGIYPNEFAVAPHTKQELNYYLQIPLDARPGGHYAAVVYTPTNNLGVAGTGASVQTQIGTLLYISINGPIKEQSFVTGFFTNPFQEYGPVSIKTEIKNLGDLHIRPIGAITVTDVFGRTIQKANLDEHNVFPTAVRDYVNTMGQNLMIGPFKASLQATYGKNNDLPLVASVYFWVFPWKVTVVLILIIVAAILGYKYWKKTQSGTPQKHTEKNTEQTPK